MAHTHTLVLGFTLFLILSIFAKSFNLKEDKKEKRFFNTYNFSLILVIGTIIARTFYQIYDLDSASLSAAISGIAGIGHIAIAFYFLYTYLKNYVDKKEKVWEYYSHKKLSNLVFPSLRAFII